MRIRVSVRFIILIEMAVRENDAIEFSFIYSSGLA
jgi:hypothetical protein